MIRGRKEGSNYSTWFIGFDHELPTPSRAVSTRPSPVTRTLGPNPVTRAGSLDTLNLLSTPSSSKRLKTRTSDPASSSSSSSSKPRRALDLGKARTPDPGGARARREEAAGRKDHKDTKETIYKHAFESARQAEELKFRAKFDLLLNDLHQTLDSESPKGLADNFASTSYGEVMLSFRGRVKDLLVGFTQRLQLAYESFDSSESAEEQSQQVKQNVSRLLEDLLGESLDLTSDEAVSDLSSLSDDSANDRHAFEDQLAQAVVSKILDNHRREVHHSLHEDRRSRFLSNSQLVPEALNDEEDENDEDDDRRSPTADDVKVKDTDISKDFEDLRNFVHETQSRSRQFSERSARAGSPVDTAEEEKEEAVSESADGREKDWSQLSDFSQFEQIDFNSCEVDPDLLQMNLAMIPEETEEQLEDEAEAQWRENWIFRGHLRPANPHPDAKKWIRGDDDQPQYLMVPEPEDDLEPMVGNKGIDQLSDLSDEDLTDDNSNDDDNTHPFYPDTSSELARISHHQRSISTPSLFAPSLAPSLQALDDHHLTRGGHSLSTAKRAHSSSHLYGGSRVEVEDVGVGTEDGVVVPLVEKRQELKLVEELIPAEEDDPKFSVEPESVVVEEGEPLKLECRVSGTQPIDVFWYREQQEVEELEEGEEVELQADGDRHQVTLYNLARHHAGQYLCIALSDLGKAVKYFTVTVKDNKQELKKPEFLKELSDTEVLEGQRVKFRCKVKGYPQPRINWYKDGKLMRSNPSCRIEKFGNRDYTLTVDYATMNDDAEYMVVAKNVAGEVRSSAQVIVEPYADDHPLLLKSRSQSMSTVYTDTESGRPSSLLLEDFVLHPSGSREHLSSEEGQMNSLFSKMGATKENMRQEAENMLVTADEGQAARNVRKLTSNALSVLRAAEEIIQSEKNLSGVSSASSRQGSRSPPLHGDHSNSLGSLTSAMDQSSLTGATDLNQSVSSGYGTISMASSAVDGNDDALDPSLSQLDQDDFALSLPPLDDPCSGPYREEVSLSVTSSQPARTPPRGASSSSSSSTLTDSSASSSGSSGRTVKPLKAASPLNSSADSDLANAMDHVQSSSARSAAAEVSPGEERLLLNFGPKDINTEAYSRDYEVAGATREGEGKGQKRWSVNLDPYMPTAEVVNRQPSLEETEEQIYLSAGRMFHLEERVKELQARVDEDNHMRSAHSLSRLEDQVADTAARVARSEKEVSGIERAVHTLQFSPRSSRGSTSSTPSTPRESIDSGVSSFHPDRPQHVQLAGHSREGDLPDTRPEFDADSGIELPSVTRLRSVFGARATDDEPCESSLRREIDNSSVHSITARSLTRDQLQELRKAGNTVLADRDSPPHGKASLRPPASQGAGTSRQQQRPSRHVTPTAGPGSSPAHYKDLDPNNQPVLIYPDTDSQASPASFSSKLTSPALSSGVLQPGDTDTPAVASGGAVEGQGAAATPKIRSGCISARAAFWERRIMQGEATDVNVEEEFPEMVQDSHA